MGPHFTISIFAGDIVVIGNIFCDIFDEEVLSGDPLSQPTQSLHFNVSSNPTADWTAQQVVEAFPWDRTKVFDAGFGCNLWLFLSQSSEKYGYQRSGLGSVKPLAKIVC